MSQADFYRGVEAAAACLARHPGSPPAVRAAAVHAATTPLLESTPESAARACRVGCDHCCHLPVGVTFGEAMLLAEVVRKEAELRHVVQADAAGSAALAWADLVGRPCPLLREGACSVHAHRPLPCRALASSDAGACARALRGRAVVPVDDASFWRGLGAAHALAAAETAEGTRELRSAIAAILAAPVDGATEAFRSARAACPS